MSGTSAPLPVATTTACLAVVVPVRGEGVTTAEHGRPRLPVPRAARSAAPLRSNALVGMHAQ
jgi:hypothetical protein